MAAVPPITVPVVIVQDEKSIPQLLWIMFESVVSLLLKSWVVMLLLGNATDWGLSYMQVLVAVAILGAIQSDGGAPWRLYTRTARK